MIDYCHAPAQMQLCCNYGTPSVRRLGGLGRPAGKVPIGPSQVRSGGVYLRPLFGRAARAGPIKNNNPGR